MKAWNEYSPLERNEKALQLRERGLTYAAVAAEIGTDKQYAAIMCARAKDARKSDLHKLSARAQQGLLYYFQYSLGRADIRTLDDVTKDDLASVTINVLKGLPNVGATTVAELSAFLRLEDTHNSRCPHCGHVLQQR